MAENPPFGRKVFFLNPTFSVLRQVIKILRESEYEIYTIDDYQPLLQPYIFWFF